MKFIPFKLKNRRVVLVNASAVTVMTKTTKIEVISSVEKEYEVATEAKINAVNRLAYHSARQVYAYG